MGSRLQLAQCTPDQASLPQNEASGISPFLPEQVPVKGVYLHVPFCRHRCHYCDFYTIAGREEAFEAYVERLLDEILASAAVLQGPLETVFIGGGTPTILPPGLLKRALDGVRTALPVGTNCEWTVEANPETVTEACAEALAAGGVNRVSLGAQSFHPERLKTLERQHDPSTVGRSLDRLRQAGIEQLSLDLIFAIPGQTIEQWDADLTAALELGIDHISAYSLVYEQGTPLTRRRDRGEVTPIEEDVEAAMYEHAISRLAEAGMVHYEVSNWAREGAACRHNLLYWANEDWWAIGPGAAGHVQGVRWKNLPRLAAYLEGTGLPRITVPEQLDEDGRIGESFMMGLRLLEGMDRERVESLLAGGNRAQVRHAAIEGRVASGHLAWEADRLRLTPTGLMVADSIIMDLL
ncbi:MAG: radical SAM family heme chaperone HemW [Phycisphaerales bacterium]|nr:radical SAM family heme chaperone HemW [Phycisphaerales bacterium]